MRMLLCAAGIASACYVLATVALAWRTPIPRRWVWLLISLVCAPTVTVGRVSRPLDLDLFAVVILGIAWGHGADGSTVSVGLPLGALLFRQRRRALIAAAFPARASNTLDAI